MKKILAFAMLASLSACGKDAPPSQEVNRPPPPKFVADGNAPSPSVAVDFIKKYSDVTQAAIDRTPYGVKDSDEQMRAAQALYKVDREYLTGWLAAGLALFQAAHSNTCETYVRSAFVTWQDAYPLNGPPVQAALDSKRDHASETAKLRDFCLHATTLPIWGA
ncbi:hypothetical protein [Burkholderia gladioli]|uniref:hypothetical protein n=1 Tax=Burkholderia gladioli TaxID=28095 RepID=UPI00163F37F4|nr:hypothetical protein [Burkholderia gladioli]MBW5285741.1 hypothetical protein [Burkholderia gladioli]